MGGIEMENKTLKKAAISAATVGGIGALAAAYVFGIRPWHLRWGANEEELAAWLPGDEIMPDADIQVTHAITIDAPPENVWKWLIQIGQDRGGFYSYDWIENLFGLQIHNTDEIRPEWQELKVGDFVRGAHEGWMGGKFDGKAGWFVVGMEPNRYLILRDEIEHGSWVFILRPLDNGQTRLIVRVRGMRGDTFLKKMYSYGLLEPAHFLMERKMMLTLKEKAETPDQTIH
jgi:hypothetical protein